MDKPVVNIGQGLQGKIAGVQVVNQGAGIPGGKPMIRIRGTNSINTSSDPPVFRIGSPGIIFVDYLDKLGLKAIHF